LTPFELWETLTDPKTRVFVGVHGIASTVFIQSQSVIDEQTDTQMDVQAMAKMHKALRAVARKN